MRLTPVECKCRHNCGKLWFKEAPDGMFHAEAIERIRLSTKILANIPLETLQGVAEQGMSRIIEELES